MKLLRAVKVKVNVKLLRCKRDGETRWNSRAANNESGSPGSRVFAGEEVKVKELSINQHKKTTKTHEKHMKMDKMFNISVRCIFYTRVTQARY